MGNCCSSGPKITALIETELRDMVRFLPKLKFACVLTPDGKALVQWVNGFDQASADMIAAWTTFKKTATTFAATLQQTESPIIHLRGKNTLFVCYDIDKYSLNIFIEVPPGSGELGDTLAIDTSNNMLLTLSAIRYHISVMNSQKSKK